MAYKKTFKGAYRKGKKAYGFAKKHQGTAQKALALAQKVHRVINSEHHRKLAVYNSTVPAAGQVLNICDPAQGDTFNDRTGISIKPLRVSGRLYLTINAVATASVVRLILFRGKNENRVSYAVSDILHTASGLTWQNPKDYQERFRSKVLYDRTYNLDKNGRDSIMLNWNFKLFGHIQFGNNDITVENGGLYLLMITNEPTNLPTLQYTLQTTFIDN